jgi:hypothetical protein
MDAYRQEAEAILDGREIASTKGNLSNKRIKVGIEQ